MKKPLALMCSCFFLSNSGLADNQFPVAIDRNEHNTKTENISAEESNRRLSDAKLLFKRGKSDASIYMLQKLNESDPGKYQVLLELGRIAIGVKNWAYAINVFRKASLMRPEDIEVRLVLMDVYKAYQMPIQEVIVSKEVVALEPDHLFANQRLAELYYELGMPVDEVNIREKLKRLQPKEYSNLKRLADILDKKAELWESARVYEQIRKYHPDKMDDIQRLATIYYDLDENFRAAGVLDQSKKDNWLQNRITTKLRKENNIYDPFLSGVSYKLEQEPTLDVRTLQTRASYTRLRIRSSVDFGVSTKYSHINHKGVRQLDGMMDINSISMELNAIQNWFDYGYELKASIGFLHDDVSGRLFARHTNPNVTASVFPFLADPAFNSYGGTLPIGSVSFTARPGMHTSYSINYQHGIVEDLDARLDMFYQDKFTLGAGYQTNDRTELKLQIENAFISDGNYRFHGMAGGYYNVWASGAMYDYRGRRSRYFHQPPESFVRLGYEFDYYKDQRVAENDKYETFLSAEYRHKGLLSAQALVMNLGLEEQLLFNAEVSYSTGRTLDYRRGGLARLFYFKPDSENEFGLSYGYEEEQSDNRTENNLRIGGGTTTHALTLYTKWRF